MPRYRSRSGSQRGYTLIALCTLTCASTLAVHAAIPSCFTEKCMPYVPDCQGDQGGTGCVSYSCAAACLTTVCADLPDTTGADWYCMKKRDGGDVTSTPMSPNHLVKRQDKVDIDSAIAAPTSVHNKRSGSHTNAKRATLPACYTSQCLTKVPECKGDQGGTDCLSAPCIRECSHVYCTNSAAGEVRALSDAECPHPEYASFFGSSAAGAMAGYDRLRRRQEDGLLPIPSEGYIAKRQIVSQPLSDPEPTLLKRQDGGDGLPAIASEGTIAKHRRDDGVAGTYGTGGSNTYVGDPGEGYTIVRAKRQDDGDALPAIASEGTIAKRQTASHLLSHPKPTILKRQDDGDGLPAIASEGTIAKHRRDDGVAGTYGPGGSNTYVGDPGEGYTIVRAKRQDGLEPVGTIGSVADRHRPRKEDGLDAIAVPTQSPARRAIDSLAPRTTSTPDDGKPSSKAKRESQETSSSKAQSSKSASAKADKTKPADKKDKPPSTTSSTASATTSNHAVREMIPALLIACVSAVLVMFCLSF